MHQIYLENESSGTSKEEEMVRPHQRVRQKELSVFFFCFKFLEKMSTVLLEGLVASK